MTNELFDFLEIPIYLRGCLFICIGCIAIWFAKRHPEWKDYTFRPDISGWMGGIGLIIAGIGTIIVTLLCDLHLMK